MINRQYKDRLFRAIFGYEKYKGNLLELFNALNQTDYNDVNELEITTLDDVVYMKMKNDVSCILHSNMALYEHQSTFNPNMPLRGYMYFGKLYDKYIIKNGYEYELYGSKLLKIPTPQFYVFYNGEDEYPDRVELKLSDAFQTTVKNGVFEWTATMINVNNGKNPELMASCKILHEYAILNETIRDSIGRTEDKEKAIDYAISKCIKDGVLSDFLLEHRAEVIDMCLTEYDEEKAMEFFKKQNMEIGRELGEQIGKEIGKEETCCSLINKGLITLEAGAAELGISMEEMKKLMEQNR